jgi:hypothetical protein
MKLYRVILPVRNIDQAAEIYGRLLQTSGDRSLAARRARSHRGSQPPKTDHPSRSRAAPLQLI